MKLTTLLAVSIGAAILSVAGASAQSGETSGTFGIERGTGEVICTGDGDGLGEGRAVLDESYARSAIWDRMVLGEDYAPCAPQAAPVFQTVDTGVWERTSLFTGRDAQGRTADMRIYVLDDRFAWTFDSARSIEQDNGEPAQFSYIFGRPNFLGEFCAGDGAVALGAASYEGLADRNRVLAAQRAATLGGEMRRLAGFCADQGAPNLFTVNLGEYTQETPSLASTSPQRRVVLIGIDSASDGVNLAEAVRDGLRSPTASAVLSVDDYALYEFAGL